MKFLQVLVIAALAVAAVNGATTTAPAATTAAPTTATSSTTTSAAGTTHTTGGHEHGGTAVRGANDQLSQIGDEAGSRHFGLRRPPRARPQENAEDLGMDPVA
ncbi:hypothetical protein ON010_g8906 [Phytophthora cinnamomi]|nr:hypothetical protein ON010_g8906 [Phytophthora cinnamomi]